MVIATARPPRPGTAALARPPATMYSAQNPAETRANPTPARSMGCPPVPWESVRPSVSTPPTASSTQPTSRPRLDSAAASVSGPRNWMVTVVPRGSRASAA
jgi:hypothetical protein